MTSEIPREDWQMFFDDLTKRRFDWKTKVEVLNDDIGNQILGEDLPLSGITCEKRGLDTFIEIFIGTDDDHHQTHSIKNPTKIVYFGEREKPSGILEFEEMDGTKTLVHIIQPMPITFEASDSRQTKAA